MTLQRPLRPHLAVSPHVARGALGVATGPLHFGARPFIHTFV